MTNRSKPPPVLWTSWRDERDGTVVTVTGVHQWGCRIAVLPRGGHGWVSVEVERRRGTLPMRREKCRIDEGVFIAHFTLIYDPLTGYDAQTIIELTSDRISGALPVADGLADGSRLNDSTTTADRTSQAPGDT